MKPSRCTLLINSFPKIPRMQFKTWWFWRSQCHKANQTTLIIYINEKRTTFAKPYGIKVRCSWECVREYNGNLKNILRTSWKIIGNIMRTWWEHNVNVMGTHWEHIGNMRKMKNPLLHLHSLQTQKIHWRHFESSHLAQVYSWKEDNICQSIWIKVRCYWEHIGNKRENETRNFLNNLPSRVLRKSVTCQHWFLPWSQCEGEFPLARSLLTFIIWKRHSPLKVHMIVNKSL